MNHSPRCYRCSRDLVATSREEIVKLRNMSQHNRAWLHRRGKTTWMFEQSDEHELLVHKTARGTKYAIISGPFYGKPFWIGELCESPIGGTYWATCEVKLRARSIEFEGAGVYTF